MLYEGNPSCTDVLGPAIDELKPIAIGTAAVPAVTNANDGTLFVTIRARDADSGPLFNWSSNLGVDAVISKGR